MNSALFVCWECPRDKEFSSDHRQAMNEHLIAKHGYSQQAVEDALPGTPMETRRTGVIRETVVWFLGGQRCSFVSSYERRDPWSTQ